MTGITADSFSFKNKHIQKRNPRKHGHLLRKKELPAPPMYLIDPLELSTFASTFLRHHHLVIHQKVTQSKQIAAMAVAMGATLLTEGVDDLSYATDLVICGTENSARPRLIQQALERHIRIVSPLWVISCFREQCYKDPFLFPYHMDNTRTTLTPSPLLQDDNPFQLANQDERAESEIRSSPDKSPSLPPSAPLRPPKIPTPTKVVADILNNQSIVELLKKKKKEQNDRRKPIAVKKREDGHKNKKALFTRNGMSIWYGEKNQ